MKNAEAQRCDVLFLIRSMGRGGAERQLSLLARALHARGLRIAVAVFYAGGPLENELHAAGVEVVDLQKRGRWSNVGVLWRISREVLMRRPRILHSYMSTQNLMALLLRPWLRMQGCRVVCGIRIAFLDLRAYGVVPSIVDRCHSFLLRWADCVISNSRAALVQLEGKLPQARSYAIPNGVEPTRFTFSKTKRRSLRADWELADGSVVLGVVGRLDPQKNHAQLLEAFAAAGGRLEHVGIVFVGDGPITYRESIARRAEMLGLQARLIWAGPSDDMAAVYSALDMFCLCSSSEGFPNVLAEAMCAGLPCVTTDVGDAALLVGDSGWVVPPGDPQALAQALLQALHALPGWDRDRSRRRMVEEFSVEALADRTLVALAPFLGEVEQ